MLHQQNAHPGLGQLAEQVAQLLALGVVEAGGGLVEQEQARPGGQGAGQLEQAGLAGGERVGRPVGQVGQPDQGQHAVGVGRGVGAVPGPAPADLCGGQDVLPDRQRAEDLEPLERAGDAQSGALMRLEPGHVGVVEGDPATVEALKAADRVEARGLARPVGADQARDHAGVDVEVDAAQRVHASKSNFSFRHLQKRHRSPPLRSGCCPAASGPRCLNFFLVRPGIFRCELERLLVRGLTVSISGRTR